MNDPSCISKPSIISSTTVKLSICFMNSSSIALIKLYRYGLGCFSQPLLLIFVRLASELKFDFTVKEFLHFKQVVLFVI